MGLSFRVLTLLASAAIVDAADGIEGPYFDSRLVLPREPVAHGAMRITTMGSGMPYTRRAQASASFLVQLGDGKQSTFLFDVGSGSMANVNAAGIEYAKLNTVFLTHYHVDHTGDLPALWGGGMVMGRLEALHVYGPSGSKPQHGLNHFCDGLRAFAKWDIDSRMGRVPSGEADQLACHEFDYSKKMQVVYDKGGVVVTSTPVVHVIDGAVAYRISWNGHDFTFSGDTKPSTNMVELAKGSDVFVHETFVPPEVLAHAMSLPLESARHVVEHLHTPLKSAGKVFDLAKPKLAVGYHLWLNHQDLPEIVDEVRKTYKGPLAIADDLDVFEITSGGVRLRKHLLVDRPFPIPDRSVPQTGGRDVAGDKTCDEADDKCNKGTREANLSQRTGMSQFLLDTVIEVE